MRNFVVTIDGRQYQVGVEEVGATSTPVVTEVKTAPVQAKAPVAAAPAAKPAGNMNGEKINAPMPGMIKSLAVAEGSQVKEGDVILVLEAMKMDNDITAPCSGTISYKVASGNNVDTGDLMAVIG